MDPKARLVTGIAAALASLAAPAAAMAQPTQTTHGLDPVRADAMASVAQAAPAAAGWCANTEPGANQVQNGDHRYHAIYVHASDRPNRLESLGAALQQDAFGASAVLEQTYGRAIRFDVGTPCGPGQLDISAVRLPQTAEQLAALADARGTATFDAVRHALAANGFGVADDYETPAQLAARHENYLVWLDGPAPARSCGQGTALIDRTRSDTNLNNFGGKLAVIFRNGTDFCGADVVRHEIGHNLGALQPNAPNTADGVHCNDAFEDTMCAWESPKVASGPFNGVFFDYGNDDYWDPPQGPALGWWTLNLSRFICPATDCNRPPGSRPPSAAQADPPTRAERRADRRRARALRPRLAKRVRRGERYTRLRLRARGAGRARIVVTCRRPGPNRRITRRRVALPAVVRVRTRCRRPHARLGQWQRPRAARSTDRQ